MVSMIIHFDEKKLENEKYSVEQLLGAFDNYCSKNEILKPRINVFEKEGEHAVADISKLIFEIEKTRWMLELIDDWFWVINGKKENLLEDASYWSKKLRNVT